MTIPRALLEKYFGRDPRMLRAMEEQSSAIESNSAAVEATTALKDATVIVLSANGDFTNERVLEWGEGIDIEVTDTTVRISTKNVARTQDYEVTLAPPAAGITLLLPAEGTLVSDVTPAILENKSLKAPTLQSIPNYANDAAAATGGVPVGGVYRNASVLQVRVT
jgi:hypothetical protein